MLELKDKVSFVEGDEKIVVGQGNTLKIESLSALVMLGYQKSAAEKVVDAQYNKLCKSKFFHSPVSLCFVNNTTILR